MSEHTFAVQTHDHAEPGAQLLDARGERGLVCTGVTHLALHLSGHRTRQDTACSDCKPQDSR
jgi:hypothetical protein